MTRAACRLVVLAIALPLAAVAQQPQPINFNSNDWPPYFVDGRGFARELLQLCLPAAGFAPKFSDLPLEQTFPALQSGVLDAHVMSRSADRDRYLEFGSEPLFRDGYRAVARRGSGLPIRELRDFDRLRLGYLQGVRYTTEYLEYVRRPGAAAARVAAGSNEELVRLLVDGKIDVFVGLASSARWTAASLGVADQVEILPFELKNSDYFLAVSRTSRRVTDRRKALDAFDACLAQAKRDGRYARLVDTYHLGS